MGNVSGIIKSGDRLYIDVSSNDTSTTYDYSIAGASTSISDRSWWSDKEIGPFQEDVSYSISSTGDVSVYIVKPSGNREYPEESPPSAESLNAGDVVVVSGLANIKTGDRLAPNEIKQRKTPRLCFVGSSLTQHGNGWGPTKISWDSRGWPCWLMALMQDSAIAEQWTYTAPDGKQYTVGSNRGFSGQYASEIDARKADIAAMGADYYIVQQGTNDLASKTTAETSAAVISTAKALRDTGAKVVLLPEPPRWFSLGSGWESGGVAQLRRQALNTAKRQLADSERDILCADSENGLVQASGDAVAAQFYDGTHLASSGAYQWALNSFNLMVPAEIPFREHIVNAQNVYDATNNPKGSLVANPTLQSNASGWTKSAVVTGISAFTVATQSDGSLLVTITTDGTGPAGAVSAVSLLRDSPITHNIGEAVYTGVKIRSVSQTVPCLYGVKPYTRCSKTGETIIYGFGMEKYLSSSYPGSKTSYWPAIGARSLYCRTPRVVIPYNGASIKAGIYFEFNAAVAGVTTIVLEGIDCFSVALPWDAVGVKQDTGYASQNIYGGSDI